MREQLFFLSRINFSKIITYWREFCRTGPVQFDYLLLIFITWQPIPALKAKFWNNFVSCSKILDRLAGWIIRVVDVLQWKFRRAWRDLHSFTLVTNGTTHLYHVTLSYAVLHSNLLSLLRGGSIGFQFVTNYGHQVLERRKISPITTRVFDFSVF